MADDEKRSSKRSRFDQTEPDSKRSSRFDRRSRSPSNRHSETQRSRSPVNRDVDRPESRKSNTDAASAAGIAPASLYIRRLLTYILAAAAARINAQIQAKRGIQHVDVPPIRSVRIEVAHAVHGMDAKLLRLLPPLPNLLRQLAKTLQRRMWTAMCTSRTVTILKTSRSTT